MSKLKELERRLRDEPDNLGLRVAVAGALHEAGRRDDAIELYRSVALAYREQGRTQQAITVCRRILELAPDDVPCRELIDLLAARPPAALEAPPGRSQVPPIRPSPSRLPWPRFSRTGSEAGEEEGDGPASRPSSDATPLPPAVPYHVADPTSVMTLPRSALPPSLREELERYPQVAGIADAARQVSEALIAASPDDDEADDDLFDLDTRRIPRGRTAEPTGRFTPPAMVEFGDDDDADDDGGDRDDADDPTFPPDDGTPRAHIDDDDERSALSPVNGVPHVRIDGAERPTRSPVRGVPRARIIDDEKTARRELPSRMRPPKE